MQVTIQAEKNIPIAIINGRLDAVTAPELEKELSSALDDTPTAMILDLTEVEYISSAGLRVILTTAKKVKSAQGQIVLCGLQETVMQIFEISGFCAVLNIVDSKEDAIAQF